MRNAKKLQAKAKQCSVRRNLPGRFTVTSPSGETYKVQITRTGGSCSCRWGQTRGRSGCAHVVAAYGYVEQMRGRVLSAWTAKAEAKRQRRPAAYIGDGVWLTTRVA